MILFAKGTAKNSQQNIMPGSRQLTKHKKEGQVIVFLSQLKEQLKLLTKSISFYINNN